MKKVFLKTILLSFVSLTVLSLIACDNFFGAGLLKQNLEKEIEYLNQPEVSIQIELEESKQGKIYPNGNKDCRVTDIFSVTYKPSAEYQFVKWIVKDYKTGLELTDVLKIENPEELETDVEVIGTAENVYLFPLVYQRPAVETFSPVKLETGSPKDSSIVFTFTKKLSPDNDLSKIQITSAGDTVTSNYLTPVLNENILTIAANKNNLLDVKSGKTRTVTVRIPEDFYYEEGNTKVPVGSEITYSFSVNSTTNDKAEITISVPKTTGTVNPNGTGNYNIDDVIKLSFEPNDNYEFVAWNVVVPDGENVASVLNFDSLSDMNTSVTVLKDVKGVSITPVSRFIPGVKSVSPEMESNGVNCDSTIVIKFKSPMRLSSFRFEDSEIPEGAIKLLDKENYCYGYKLENDVYYKNIKIENKINGDNLNKYYSYPNLSSDGCILSLTVDYENLLLPANSNDFVNILVKINTLGTVKDSDDNYMTGIYETQYRLNSNRDRTAPSDVKFFIAKNDEDLANAIETQNSPLSTKKYSDWEEEDFILNHARQLKLYVRGCETDNKINKVKVYETLVKNFNTTEIESENQITLIGYSSGSFTSVENEQDVWEGYLTYDFVSKNDGIVKLEFVVEDYLGNGNTICTYYVNKDTKVSHQTLFIASENHIELPGTTTISNDDFGSYADITSIYPDSANKNIVDEAGECIFWISKLEDAVLIDRRGDLFWDYKRDGIDVFKYEVLWSESKEGLENGNCFSSGILGTETIIRYNPTYGYSKHCYKIDNLDKSKNYYYKVLAYDSLGNSVSCYGIKPKQLSVIDYYFDKYSNNLLQILLEPTGLLLNGMKERYRVYCSFDGENFETILPFSGFYFEGPTITIDNISNPQGNDEIYFMVKPIFESTSFVSVQYVGTGSKSNIHYTGGQTGSIYKARIDSSPMNENKDIEMPVLSFTYDSAGSNTGITNVTVNLSLNDYDKLFITGTFKDDVGMQSLVIPRGITKYTFEMDTMNIYSTASGNYKLPFNYGVLVYKGDGYRSEGYQISTLKDDVVYNLPPKLTPEYIATDMAGDYLILNAPKSVYNIPENNIKIYYTEYEYPSVLNNSYDHSDAAKAIELTNQEILLPEEIKTFNTLPVSYYSKTDISKIKIPVKELPNKKYLICIEATDSAGNSICSSYVYYVKKYNTYGYDKPIVVKSTNSSLYKEEYSSNQGNYVFEVQKLSNNNWITTKKQTYFKYSSPNFYYLYPNAYSNSEGYYRVLVHGSTSAYSILYNDSGVYRMDSYGGYYKTQDTTSLYAQFTYPQYVYIRNTSGTSYANYPLSDVSDTTTEIKEGLVGAFAYYQAHPNVTGLTGSDEIVIQAKYPVLVQTVCSKTNWTEEGEDEQKNAVLWEQHVPDDQIKNIQVLRPAPKISGNPDLMLYRVDTSGIPNGYYYVVIAHFADGTSKLSSVYHK